MTIDDSIPAAHRNDVAQALRESFGDASIVAIEPLTGGRSGALVYRVDTAGASAVIRIVTRRTPLSDPERQFATMRAAAAREVAPPLYYADAGSGVAITGFIPAVPWQEAFDANIEHVADLGRTVRRLHDGPAFPEFLDVFQCIEQGLAVVATAGATLPPLFATFLDEFAAVKEALVPHCTLGPSHNDLNPGNLLYDGKRPWLIDWESAWQNDPFFDVATMLHWFGFDDGKEAALLRGYFGTAPTRFQQAKLELTRQVVSCYYATVFLLITLQAGEVPPPLDPDPQSLPTFAAARMAMGRGEWPLESAADRVRFALVMIDDARRRAITPFFADAVEVLRATPAT